jgi:hypothetical protein
VNKKQAFLNFGNNYIYLCNHRLRFEYLPFEFKYIFFYQSKSAKQDRNKKEYIRLLKTSGIFMCGA